MPLDNADIPCAFWDALPEPGSEHPDLLAIEALKAESSPLERAETLKVTQREERKRESWKSELREGKSSPVEKSSVNSPLTSLRRPPPPFLSSPQVQANDALKRGMQLKKAFYVLEGVGLYNEALALLAPSVERATGDDFVDERRGGGGGGAGSSSAASASDAAVDAKKESAAAKEAATAAAAAAAAPATPPQPHSSAAAAAAAAADASPSYPPPTPEEIAAMRATLLSNRAQAHLALGNDRRALADALSATKIDPQMTKAFFRAARAALRLGEWRACEDAIARGEVSAVVDANNEDATKGVLADFEALSLSLSKAEAAAVAAEKEKAEALALARAPSLALARKILEPPRRWRVGYPQLSVGSDRNKPWEEAEGVIHWPLVFVYPQSGATDAVEVASELDPLSVHLDAMFGSIGDSDSSSSIPPLPWDEEGAYRSRKDIELYYLSHATEPLPDLDSLADVLHRGWPEGLKASPPQRHGPKAAKAIEVDERWTLGEVLSREDFVVPGIPAFFVLSKSKRGKRAAEVRRRFLEENG